MLTPETQQKSAIFVSNEKFLDASYPEGGVKFCTDEFISLIRTAYTVIPFPVKTTNGTGYRLSKKLGLSAYNDYHVDEYRDSLKKEIEKNNCSVVFLNLTNTAPFAALIKNIFPSVKLLLCSHGNESGDFLHDISRHKKYSGLKKLAAEYTLGKMLAKESEMRRHIDLVLTVSEVEVQLENWLGAKDVFMVSRTMEAGTPAGEPIEGRTGFLADLSHEPNFYGISKVCESISRSDFGNTTIRLCGSGKERGQQLENKYPFVKYLGHLPEEALRQEIFSWTFALNPVLYYSRGVSTKLGKILGMGVPVISTDKGLRGYTWSAGKIPVCKNENEMASMIVSLSNDPGQYLLYREEVKRIQASCPSLTEMMSNINILLNAEA